MPALLDSGISLGHYFFHYFSIPLFFNSNIYSNTIILIVWKNMKFTLSFIKNGVIIKNLFEVILSFGLLYNIETEKDMGIIFLKLDSAFCIAWQTYGG